METKLPYGLRDNELISIDEVESGLCCECVCPACKKQLIAVKGEINAHHFAHYKTKDCNSGIETALHMLSKEIIANQKTFTTPQLLYPNTEYLIYPEMEIPIDNVRLAKKLGGIIPDIIIESKGKIFLVEIVVTNPIHPRKSRNIRLQNIPTVVIDAKHLFQSFYLKRNFGLKNNEFQNKLVNGTKYKSWEHNPKINKMKAHLASNYSEEKIVKSFKSKEFGYYNFVEDCPLEKKVWKSGRNKGKPYASPEYDCNSCVFCLGVDHEEVPHRKIDFYTYSIPRKVHCLGYLKNDFSDLLQHLG